jgi:hypothetical protein
VLVTVQGRVVVWIRSGFNDFVDPDPDPGAKKKKKGAFCIFFICITKRYEIVGTTKIFDIKFIFKKCVPKFCFGSGSGSALYPDSRTLWIRIRIQNELK